MTHSSFSGNAVIEGIAVSGSESRVIAYRDETGEIVCNKTAIPQTRKVNIPIVRGMVFCWTAIREIKDSLLFSARRNNSTDEKFTFGDGLYAFIKFFFLALIAFIIIPEFAAAAVGKLLGGFVAALIKVLVCFGFFILYLKYLNRREYMSRIFAYRGALNKLLNQRRTSSASPDICSIISKDDVRIPIYLTMVYALLVYAFISLDSGLLELLIKLILLPVIAGLAGEIYAIYCLSNEAPLWKILIFPALMIQKETVIEPNQEMLATAIAAFQEAEEPIPDEFKQNNPQAENARDEELTVREIIVKDTPAELSSDKILQAVAAAKLIPQEKAAPEKISETEAKQRIKPNKDKSPLLTAFRKKTSTIAGGIAITGKNLSRGVLSTIEEQKQRTNEKKRIAAEKKQEEEARIKEEQRLAAIKRAEEAVLIQLEEEKFRAKEEKFRSEAAEKLDQLSQMAGEEPNPQEQPKKGKTETAEITTEPLTQQEEKQPSPEDYYASDEDSNDQNGQTPFPSIPEKQDKQADSQPAKKMRRKKKKEQNKKTDKDIRKEARDKTIGIKTKMNRLADSLSDTIGSAYTDDNELK